MSFPFGILKTLLHYLPAPSVAVWNSESLLCPDSLCATYFEISNVCIVVWDYFHGGPLVEPTNLESYVLQFWKFFLEFFFFFFCSPNYVNIGPLELFHIVSLSFISLPFLTLLSKKITSYRLSFLLHALSFQECFPTRHIFFFRISYFYFRTTLSPFT